jgi:hypothetical protein
MLLVDRAVIMSLSEINDMRQASKRGGKGGQLVVCLLKRCVFEKAVA